MYYINQFPSILELIRKLPLYSQNKPYLVMIDDSFAVLLCSVCYRIGGGGGGGGGLFINELVRTVYSFLLHTISIMLLHIFHKIYIVHLLY